METNSVWRTQRRIFPIQTTVDSDHSHSASTTARRMAMCGHGDGLFLEIKSRKQSVICMDRNRIRKFINQRQSNGVSGNFVLMELTGRHRITRGILRIIRGRTKCKNVLRFRITPNNGRNRTNGRKRSDGRRNQSPHPDMGIFADRHIGMNRNRNRIGMRRRTGTGPRPITLGCSGCHHKRAPSQAETVKRRAYVRTYVRT